MSRASVLIPTHSHRAATLPFAVASVQAQNIEDIEILIVGDGVDDSVRSTVERLQATDSRIRFFDFPKGPRNGEIHRDGVLRQARGRIVCYQADDDLWLPRHLQDMETALENADFVGAMHVNVDLEGRARGYFFDLERPEFKEPWLIWQPNHYGSWASNGFGLAFAAHRLDAYLRLPEGWSTTPAGVPTDQFMWIKFARQPWCKMRSLQWPVSLHFPAPDRRNWTPEQRTEELRHWTQVIESPDYAVRIWRDILPDLGSRLLSRAVKITREKNSSLEPQSSKRRPQPSEMLPHAGSQTSRESSMPRAKQQMSAFDNWKINLTRLRRLRRHRCSSFRQCSVLRDQRRSTEFAN